MVNDSFNQQWIVVMKSKQKDGGVNQVVICIVMWMYLYDLYKKHSMNKDLPSNVIVWRRKNMLQNCTIHIQSLNSQLSHQWWLQKCSYSTDRNLDTPHKASYHSLLTLCRLPWQHLATHHCDLHTHTEPGNQGVRLAS